MCSEAAVASALADPSLGITHLISIGYPPPGASRGRRRRRRRRRIGRRFERARGEDAERGARGRRGRGPAHADPRLRRVHPGRPAAPRRQPRRGGGGGERRRCGAAASSSAASTRRGGGALVHCHAGVSRSCAVIAAHVMKTRGVDADDALEVVRRAHPRRSQRGLRGSTPPVGSMDCKLNMADEAYRLYSVARSRGAGVPRVRRRHGRPTGSGLMPRRRHSWRRHSWRRKVDRFVPFSGSATLSRSSVHVRADRRPGR